jgi:transcriptional regulator with AAA-type ATPase domain/tetratricopeptide (TPR) repeat protein
VPAALLVEHPAVPVPRVDGTASESPPTGDIVSASSLSRRERYSAALQLTAAASLLAEFDLWPGQAAIKAAHFVRTPSGLQVSLARFPLPMSRVYSRLGGGEGAAATTRTAVLGAISEAVGLAPASIDHLKGEPGFFLEAAIARQLRELKQPLDPCTARALWAFRWDGLPTPEEGATNYWRVPLPRLARRLGGSLWAAIRRRRGNAWLWAVGLRGEEVPPMPAISGEGTLILVGDISNDELAAVSRWSQRDRCSAVVIGSFPAGWYPPGAPGFDAQNLFRHLAVTGMPLEDARRVVEQREGRIDPLEAADRRALTEAAGRVFTQLSGRSRAPRRDAETDVLRRTLALSPDGLPPGFVALHTRLGNRNAEERRQELAIVDSGGRWRLSQVVPLEADPLHLAVADLYDVDDPRRLLHRALGGSDTTALETWARNRLDELDGFSVRDLLSVVSSGALGYGVGALLVEACLSVHDVSGARRTIDAMPAKRCEALIRWLDALDDRSGVRRKLPEKSQLDVAPRAVAETAILVLNEERRRGGGRADAAHWLIDRAVERVSPMIRRRIQIELAWIADSGEFDDPAWRRRVLGDHPVLRAQYAHRRALQLMDRGQPRSVRRLLDLLKDDSRGPGFLGLIEHDLGATALDEGRSLEADRHQLRAYRLLQAAGYRNVTQRVLFNLAVADLDQLEIRRAEDRLAELAKEDPDGPYMRAEWARLALARGNLAEFRSQLEAFEKGVHKDNPRFAEGLHLLLGVAALFDGELAQARGTLEDAGQEGVAWAGLVDTIAGREAGSWQPDTWGVSLAAELLDDARNDGGRVAALLSSRRMTRSHALGIALAEHLGRLRLPITEPMRADAVRVLREGRMNGWADAVAGTSRLDGAVVEALAGIVERGGPEDLEPDLALRLMTALGVGGLELRDAVDGRLIWHFGSGTPGTELRQGRIVVVPLGGEVHEGATWRLFTGILDLCVPTGSAPIDPEIEETGFFGISAGARSVRRELCELGPTHLPILLVGETGVGKEVAARALHRLSERRGPFVPVNVAAIPATLLEAELFGSVKGAYTGADRARQGLAVAADRGTLFLDEVGDLDPPLQVKLLRFLDSQEVRPVGATHSKTVDVRILSATNTDLDRRVREGGFRQDLYYRIAAPPLTIPPLRERREDIGLLRDIFEREAVTRHGLAACSWSSEAEAMMRRHLWPGNVRELRQAVEVALVRAGGGVVRTEHLPITETEQAPSGTWDEAQRDFRRKFLCAALERNDGNRSATARELGISRQALLYHLRNLGLSGGRDR